jgi:aryl-alcohol dehydrogenase-like predicted oxidoreductase
MSSFNRRQFLGAGILATGAFALGLRTRADDKQKSAETKKTTDASTRTKSYKPTDRVSLGSSGVKASIVGLGTGTHGWGGRSQQMRIGQEEFTRLLRHALDRGINLFDLADQYGTNPYFGRAMQGVARDKYVIQTKTNSRDGQGARNDIDRFLKELGTDYIDSLIIHCVTEADWTTRFREVMDVFEDVKKQGKIRAHGVTCHSFEALEAALASDWVQINMVRWNQRGAHMDADVEKCRALFQKMRAKEQGMIGMKVVGQGDIVRGGNSLSVEECCRFQIESGVVDAFVVGVRSAQEIDELLRGTQLALNEVGYQKRVE